jgi:dienelactone hydrolase
MAMRRSKAAGLLALAAVAMLAAGAPQAGTEPAPPVDISFIQFQSPNLDPTLSQLGNMLTIEGKLSVPEDAAQPSSGSGTQGNRKIPAVLILHGSAGVDARGDFYEAALNQAGIATLQIDMWQARGYTTTGQRPAAIYLTYPDAFSALKFLSQQPNIDPARIGVLGFSWGGLVSMGAAELLYSSTYGNGLTFKAHVAHYPVCYAWNNTDVATALGTTPAQFGVQWINLTGAPVLIEVGTKDGYDNGSGPCEALAASVNPSNGGVVSVDSYPGATHAWDRLMVPIVVSDPFADQGSYILSGFTEPVPTVQVTPDVDQAFQSRARVVRFFEKNL